MNIQEIRNGINLYTSAIKLCQYRLLYNNKGTVVVKMIVLQFSSTAFAVA